jgi:hypothetical protein
VEQAVAKLTALGLLTRTPDGVAARPGLARYAVGESVVLEPGVRTTTKAALPTQRKARER